MLRCDAIADAGGRELKLLAEADAPEYPNREDTVAATKRMQNTTYMRADAYFTILFAALYSVVEKWLEWDFSDPAVDALLADKEKLRRLEKYRHTVFHADYYDHDDFTAMAKDEDLRSWSAQLAVATRAYLRRWHADPVAHVTQHMERVRRSGAV